MDLPFDSAIPLLRIYPKEPQTIPKEHKHPYVQCSVIYSHQDMEAALCLAIDMQEKQPWVIYIMETTWP